MGCWLNFPISTLPTPDVSNEFYRARQQLSHRNYFSILTSLLAHKVINFSQSDFLSISSRIVNPFGASFKLQKNCGR